MRHDNVGLCFYWNGGQCFAKRCKFIHEEIPACRFQFNFDRSDCKFGTRRVQGSSLFLGRVRIPHPLLSVSSQDSLISLVSFRPQCALFEIQK